MNPPAEITASIVTYRSGPVIVSCLQNLLASTRRPLDVVVFDNASDDDTLARLQPFTGRVRVVAHPVNLGFGQGHNRALADAAGAYFLLLNPDIAVPPGSLDQLVRHLEEHPECGAVAPRLDEASANELAGFSRRYPGQRYAPKSFRQLPGEVAILQGACVLIRAALFREIGGFDPRYFLYAEDLDLSLEVRRRGWTLAYAADVVVRHLGGHSEQGRPLASVAARKYAGLILFYRKHYPARTVAFLLARDLLKFSGRLLVLSLRPGGDATGKAAEYRGRLQAWRHHAFRTAPAARPLRCLFIKPKMIGDTLLLTPTLHAVRRRHPEAVIDVLVRRGSESILEGCTAHNRALLTARPHMDRGRHRRRTDWADLRALRRQSYDWIFECSDTDRGRFLARLARGRHRVFNRRELELRNSWLSRRFWLAACSDTVNFEWGRQHAIESDYLLARDFLDLPQQPPALEYRPERFAAGGAHLRGPADFALSPDRLVIHCGTRLPAKAWPEERWLELVAALAPRFTQLFLSIGPSVDEGALARRLVALDPSRIFCPDQPLPWSQLAALLQGARLFVGVDTAAMHLAAACRCPSVIIWGPVSPVIFGPSGPDSVLVLADRVAHPPFSAAGGHDEARLASRNSTATVLRAVLELAGRPPPAGDARPPHPAFP